MSPRSKPADGPAPGGVDPTYLALRGRLLGTSPSELGLVPTGRLPRVWAVLADLSVGGAFATVVGIADGTTSMYTSTGGGIIGAGSRPEVAAVTARLLEAAERCLDAMTAADTADLAALPAVGHVAFVALTRGAMRRVEVPEDEAQERPGPAHDLYLATHDVITQLRLAGARGRGDRD